MSADFYVVGFLDPPEAAHEPGGRRVGTYFGPMTHGQALERLKRERDLSDKLYWVLTAWQPPRGSRRSRPTTRKTRGSRITRTSYMKYT